MMITVPNIMHLILFLSRRLVAVFLKVGLNSVDLFVAYAPNVRTTSVKKDVARRRGGQTLRAGAGQGVGIKRGMG